MMIKEGMIVVKPNIYPPGTFDHPVDQVGLIREIRRDKVLSHEITFDFGDPIVCFSSEEELKAAGYYVLGYADDILQGLRDE